MVRRPKLVKVPKMVQDHIRSQAVADFAIVVVWDHVVTRSSTVI